MGRGTKVTLMATRADAAVIAESSAPCAIRIDNVTKTFMRRRGNVRALEAMNFGVPLGQFVSILGPSGCGKSTLLRIVAGLTSPDAGGTVEVLSKVHRGVPDDLGVHATPFGLVRIIPVSPTTTARLAAAAAARRRPVVPETRGVHVSPEGLVKIVPFAPTVMNCCPSVPSPNKSTGTLLLGNVTPPAVICTP